MTARTQHNTILDLLDLIEARDPDGEDHARFNAAYEVLGGDEASRLDLIADMRAWLRDYRRGLV